MKIIFCLMTISCFISCNTREKDNKGRMPAQKLDSTRENIQKPADLPAEIYNPNSKLFVWKTGFNFTKTKNHELNKVILNADSLIKGLNELHENIFMEKIKLSGDTIYTIIRNGTYLSESLGSSGAEMYLADAVLNLTEVPGIKYVDINIEEGSHMEPGTWSQENFSKYKEKK